ncbi:MAG: hypothetical protein XD49_1388 [Caldanaerobacter subterraneus]|nr:MAG: hypothetical protein XD49_1388 [Caldanaerobacter subterraneus]
MLFSNLALGIKTILPHFKHFIRISIPTLKISHSSEPQGCFFFIFTISPTWSSFGKAITSNQSMNLINQPKRCFDFHTLLTKLCVNICYCNICMRIRECNLFSIKYFFYPVSYIPFNFPLFHRLCFRNNRY